MASLVYQGLPPWWLWSVATVGNTLGAVVNWALGRYLLHYSERPWFPFKAGGLERSQLWFGRYGKWSLLLAWMPVIGDALTFIAGTMKIRLWVLVLLAGLGKALRYWFLIGLVIATGV